MPLNYSANPGVNGVSYRVGCSKWEVDEKGGGVKLSLQNKGDKGKGGGEASFPIICRYVGTPPPARHTVVYSWLMAYREQCVYIMDMCDVQTTFPVRYTWCRNDVAYTEGVCMQLETVVVGVIFLKTTEGDQLVAR